MLKTRKNDEVRLCDKLTVDSIELQTLLGCGRHTASEIGLAAGAKLTIGRRVLWNVAKVQAYLDKISACGE